MMQAAYMRYLTLESTKEKVELTLQSSPYVRNRLTLLRLSKLLEW